LGLQTSIAGAHLRQPLAYETFRFGGISFIDYRGTDDNSTIAIAADKCKFFPVGQRRVPDGAEPGRDIRLRQYPGPDVYAMTIPDRDRSAFVRIEPYTCALYICTRPEILQRARN
jgi:hypothetical protein